MVHVGIPLHVMFGELAAGLFFWTFAEVYRGVDETNIGRVKMVSLGAVVSLFLAWIIGGQYYLSSYSGTVIQEAIEAGPQPWGHEIFMEWKEHAFLVLPGLAILQQMIFRKSNTLTPSLRRTQLWITGAIFLIAISMAGMGWLVTSSFRAASSPETHAALLLFAGTVPMLGGVHDGN